MKRIILIILMLVLTAAQAAAAGETAADPYRTAGSIVTLGSFEQDNNPDNGPEAIEWIVLDVQDGKSLLVSTCILDARKYNETYAEITWEDCSLRAWLNDAFFASVFREEEQSAILTVETDNSAAQGCSRFRTSGGNNTQDRVFLLSYAETERYFSSEAARRCPVTDYSAARGAHTSYSHADKRLNGLWWLRSPGNAQYRVSVVYSGGALNVTYASKESGGVRPALWLDPDLLPAP